MVIIQENRTALHCTINIQFIKMTDGGEFILTTDAGMIALCVGG